MTHADGAAGAVDVGPLLDDGPWTRAQQWFVLLTALTVVFDGADNQLLANAIPAIGREWGVARSAFAAPLAIGLVPGFRRDTLALWGAFFSCLLAVYLGFNWVPSLLTGAGLSPTVGSAGITAFNFGGVGGAILGAWAFTRVGSRLTMTVMAGGAAAGALVLQSRTITATSDTTTLIALLGLTGGLINAVQATMFALAAQIYPTKVRATGVGAAMSVGRLGAILSTYAGAWTLEAGGAALFFGLLAGAMVSTGLALALVQRHIAKW
jgi:AAHS family 4-hydroxybenzoate transporter-like MFS transporter